MSATSLRILLPSGAHVLAVGAGVAMFLRTAEASWAIAGAHLRGMMTFVFLAPALPQTRREKGRT